jgi:hypothetical protein
MSTAEESSGQRPRPSQFTLRGALAINAVIGIVLSIPLIGLGFTLTAGILLMLFVLQLPLFLLFGAFGMANQRTPEYQEWDRWREERGARR